MRALGMVGRLLLPLLSAAAYAIYVMAHRGSPGPDLISFLIPFLPLLGLALYREADSFFFLVRRIRLRLYLGRVTATVGADFQIPERLSESEVLGKALEVLWERFPGLRILHRSRGEIILETETAPLLLRVGQPLEGPDAEARHLFVGQLGRISWSPSGLELFIRDLSAAFQKMQEQGLRQASFSFELRLLGNSYLLQFLHRTGLKNMRAHIYVPEKDVAGDRPQVEIHPDLLVVRAKTPAAWERAALKYLGLAIPAGLPWPSASLFGPLRFARNAQSARGGGGWR
jgi:hypothetical protein